VKRGKVNTKDLVSKIEKLARERMTKDKVVSLSEFRGVKQQQHPYSILVIEDDETMRNALKRIFEKEGYKVITAADGTQLSVVLDDSPIDLIMLDIGLPWINGFELCEMMRENKDLENIPLVFVSGRNTEEDVRRGFAVGADDYITKPFDIEKVKKSIKTLLELNHT
jgi:two-component system aerobic respiration control protein ArcA